MSVEARFGRRLPRTGYPRSSSPSPSSHCCSSSGAASAPPPDRNAAMSANLFRAEVRAHAESSWLGRIVLIRPVSFTLLCAVAATFTGALLAYATLGEYTRKARVTGVLAPDRAWSRFSFAAVGARRSVLSGRRRAGRRRRCAHGDGLTGAADSHARWDSDVVVRLAAARRAPCSGSARASHRPREPTGGPRRRRSPRSTRAVRARRGDARPSARASASRAAASTVRTASRASGSSPRRRSTGNATWRSTRSHGWSNCSARGRRCCAIRPRWSSNRRARSRAAAPRSRPSRCNAHPSTRSASSASRSSTRRSSRPPRAPSPRSSWSRARWWSRATPLVAIVPSNATLEALLYAPSRSIGFVRAGAGGAAALSRLSRTRSSACIARTVVAVSRNPMLRRRARLHTAATGRASRSIASRSRSTPRRSAPTTEPQPLQPGMQVEADVLLDRRRLIEWIFEPLLGLAGRT